MLVRFPPVLLVEEEKSNFHLVARSSIHQEFQQGKSEQKASHSSQLSLHVQHTMFYIYSTPRAEYKRKKGENSLTVTFLYKHINCLAALLDNLQ